MNKSKISTALFASAALVLASGFTPAEARWGGGWHGGWRSAAIAAGIGAGLAVAAAAASGGPYYSGYGYGYPYSYGYGYGYGGYGIVAGASALGPIADSPFAGRASPLPP
jgi:hypothetical protein